MKAVVVLCGVRNSGKTKTLRKFFGLSDDEKLAPMQLLPRVVNGKKIYVVSLNSPQELNQFCKVEEVIKNIEKRIKKCEKASKGQGYILILPFSILYSRQRKAFNDNCIFEPIEWLRNRGFNVFLVYLKKMRTEDMLMKRTFSEEIESIEEYDRQSEDLKSLIKNI